MLLFPGQTQEVRPFRKNMMIWVDFHFSAGSNVVVNPFIIGIPSTPSCKNSKGDRLPRSSPLSATDFLPFVPTLVDIVF